MRLVVAAFVKKVFVLGRCFVLDGCCVSQVDGVMECRTGIFMVYDGVNDNVMIEYSS